MELTSFTLYRKRLVVVFGTSVLALAAACGSDAPAATTASQPTATTPPTDIPATATVTAQPATAAPTQQAPAATATSLPAAVAPTAAPTTGASPVPTNTAVPAATSTPVPAPTATPNVTFTPGVVNTVQLTASKDNTLYQSSIGATSNGVGMGLFAGMTNNNTIRRALVQFDIANLVPAGSTIESVELTMSVTRTATQLQPITLHRVTSNWGEGTSDAAANEGGGTGATPGDATWTHGISPDQAWQTPGGDFVSTASGQVNTIGNGPYTWETNATLVADVQSWVDNPGSNFGWILLGDEAESKSAKRFGSREHTSEAVRPMLVIRFTPPA